MKFFSKKKDKKHLICGNCLLEFQTIDELADHVEKRHPYKK